VVGTVVGCLLLTLAAAADKSSHFVLDPAASIAGLDRQIASPQAFLGLEIGERPIRHDEVLRYFRYLADASDRADFAEYGETPAGRALATLTISEPDDLERLPAIRSQHRRIAADPRGNARLIEEVPAVVWMGYGIHGDELSSSDAAVMLAYRLIAGEDPVIREIRGNLVVVVDPMFNPDGRARALGHVEAFGRHLPALDNQDIAHRSFWPGGRGNHYLFDLNRDALFQVQEQSRHRVKAILDAGPQLLVDAHEMDWDDTYHFGLPNEPLNPHIPAQVHESWAEFARDHGAAFDAIGRSYYTRSWNEVFYPGFYEIWPTYFGATAILHEQAATSGQSIRKSNEKLLDFRTAVANHFRSSMANLVTAAENKNRLLGRWADARSDAMAGGRTGAHKSWVVLPDNRYKYAEILRILLSQHVKVDRLASPSRADDLHSYRRDAAQALVLPENSLRIEVDQERAGIVRNLFDYHVPMSKAFLSLEKTNLDLGLDSGLYDVGAWSLPLAFDASVYWSGKRLRGEWIPVGSLADVAPERAALPRGRYGFVYTDDSLHATARLLQQGVRVRLSRDHFVHDGASYPPGSFLVRDEDQHVDVLPALNGEFLAGEIELAAVDSARILDGPDFGGDEYNLLPAPRIAVLGGPGVDSTGFGEVWHLLDRVVRIPATLLDLGRLDGHDLTRYSVIVFPEIDGDRDTLLAAVKKGPLTGWIEHGGTLITLGSASLLVAEAGIVSSRPRTQVIADYPPLMIGRTAEAAMSADFVGLIALPERGEDVLRPVVSPVARRFIADSDSWFDFRDRIRTLDEWSAGVPLTDQDRIRLARGMQRYLPSGAYLRVVLKPKHFLTHAMSDDLPVLFGNVGDVLVAGDRAELVARFAGPEDLMLSGLVWPEAAGYIAGTAYLVLEPSGKGKVISFAANPLFRGYSLGTARLFMNALLLANALDCCT
jgi:hypothetical protein